MIPSLADINNAEQAYTRTDGSPVLGATFDMLTVRWAAGARDRETALRLLFLSWYANCEPPFLTGLPTDRDTAAICSDTFAALGGVDTADPEVCFVVGLMAMQFSWSLGDEGHWTAVGQVLAARANTLEPNGPPLSVFAGRGAYGQYFSRQLSRAAQVN